jgi:ABC-type Fe3+/spermidine/putrescine transport system ATPase subunit
MLKARNLRKEYGSLVAVDDIDFEIETGEFATIVGPSGCGKTTLLRMIGGHQEPTSGTLELDGQDITYTPPQERPTSLVFQSWALFPHMTVRENIEFPIEAAGGEANGRVEELLEQVRLDPEVYADKKPAELSGGQQQRSRSRGRWRTTPTSCCSTSRWRRSTTSSRSGSSASSPT